MTLRLVRDEPPKPRRRGTRSPSIVTREAQDRARAALRSLHLGHGAWSVVEQLTGIHRKKLSSIASGAISLTAEALLRIAAAGGLSVDSLLHHKLTDSGRCPACGARRSAA